MSDHNMHLASLYAIKLSCSTLSTLEQAWLMRGCCSGGVVGKLGEVLPLLQDACCPLCMKRSRWAFAISHGVQIKVATVVGAMREYVKKSAFIRESIF